MQFKLLILTCVAALAAPFVQLVFAQTYPTKAIRVIIAQAPGSATDVVSRVVGNKLSESLGQQLVVDARPGAGGTLGTELAARAAPDGYTLFMANNSTHGSNPALYAKLSYDAVKDFAPIIYVVATPYVLSVHPSLPATSVKQLIALAKARPGQINYASAGNGSTHHLSGELLKTMAGIDIVHIPYKGTTPAIAALISGEVSIMFATVTGIQPQIKSGRARGLAVTTPKRSNMMPGLPAMAETLPGFEMLSWFGLLAPAGTPSAIVSRVNAETAKVLALPEVKSLLTAQGFEVMSGTPGEFGDYIKGEIAKITKLAKATGIKAE
jgi:tripartite-type tricarboxylate transporter receptor subunit TctC